MTLEAEEVLEADGVVLEAEGVLLTKPDGTDAALYRPGLPRKGGAPVELVVDAMCMETPRLAGLCDGLWAKPPILQRGEDKW